MMEYKIGDVIEMDFDSKVTAKEFLMMYQTVHKVKIPVENGWICNALQTNRKLTVQELTLLAVYLSEIRKSETPSCKIIQMDKKKISKRRARSTSFPVLEIEMLPGKRARTLSGREHCKVVQFVTKRRNARSKEAEGRVEGRSRTKK